MQNNSGNRIEKDLLSWHDKGQKNLMYPNYTGQEKYELKDRLKHMIAVRDKYKAQPLTKDERKTLNTTKKKINELEDQLYPTFIGKIYGRIMRSVEKVKDNMRYGKQSNTTNADQEVRSLTNRQKLKNAISEKLGSVKEKILPNSQRERKNEQNLSNHFTVTKDTFKQKKDDLSINTSDKPKHRLRIR